jgi:electron transport complex protein RnfD
MSDGTESKAAKPAVQKQPLLYISSSPHIASPVKTRTLMINVCLALAPVSIFGIALYGLPALLTILVSVASAELAEALFRKITGKELRNRDCSAAITGLLLALVLPPGTPLWMTALGAAFSIIVAKEFFGGLGANVFNPALIGRAFLLMSFPAAITTWAAPRALFSLNGAIAADALSGATPLGFIKLGNSVVDLGGYWPTIRSLFLGLRGGCIGESSIVLILAALVFLLLSGTIDWRAPVSMTLSVFVFSFLFGRDPLFAVLSGGAFFGAVFMATDYVTAPLTAAGKLIFGFGAGLITVLIRQWGSYPEGVSYGILIMNAVTPFLNRLLQKKYGYVAPRRTQKEGQNG